MALERLPSFDTRLQKKRGENHAREVVHSPSAKCSQYPPPPEEGKQIFDLTLSFANRFVLNYDQVFEDPQGKVNYFKYAIR